MAITPANVLIDNDIWPIPTIATLVSTLPTNSINEMSCADVAVAKVTNSAPSITLSPNPANEFTTINAKISNSINSVTVTVYDQIGNVVINEQWNGLSAGENRYNLITGQLSSGLYHVSMNSNGNNLHTQKLVIQ